MKVYYIPPFVAASMMSFGATAQANSIRLPVPTAGIEAVSTAQTVASAVDTAQTVANAVDTAQTVAGAVDTATNLSQATTNVVENVQNASSFGSAYTVESYVAQPAASVVTTNEVVSTREILTTSNAAASGTVISTETYEEFMARTSGIQSSAVQSDAIITTAPAVTVPAVQNESVVVFEPNAPQTTPIEPRPTVVQTTTQTSVQTDNVIQKAGGTVVSGDDYIIYLQQLRNAATPAKNLALLGMQTAPVAPHGVGFFSISGNRQFEGGRAGDPKIDGSIALGISFGDMNNLIGIQPTVSINSLTNDFADSGAFGVKIARAVDFAPAPTYIGISVDQIAGWGESEDFDPSVTGTITSYTQFDPFGTGNSYPIGLNLGVGSQANEGDVGVIAGVGIGISPYLGTSIAWDGDSVNLGAGFKVPQFNYVTLNTVLNDVFDQTDDRGITISLSLSTPPLFDGVF